MLTDLKFKSKVFPVSDDKNSMKGATAMKTYKVFESGLYIGAMKMSPAKVAAFTAQAVYTLIPVEGGR